MGAKESFNAVIKFFGSVLIPQGGNPADAIKLKSSVDLSVSNPNLDGLNSHRFIIQWGGKDIGHCQTISGIGASRQVVMARSGGDNGMQYPLPGTLSYSNITISRVTIREDRFFFDWLMDNVENAAPRRMNFVIKMLGSKIERTTQTVGEKTEEKLNKTEKGAVRVIELYDAIPVSWKMTNLQANESPATLSLDSLELAVSYLIFKDSPA